ncbi:MAG: hypothetical protein WC378_10300 [Opitutaceae bacterium]|jgi:hypothetical protein
MQTKPLKTSVVVITRDENNRIQNVRTSDGIARFEYSSEGMLLLCASTSRTYGERQWGFRYVDGLLTGFARAGLWRNYYWADAKRRSHFADPIQLPPKVCSDGEFAYESVPGFSTTTRVNFSALLSREQGWWEYNSVTGNVKIHRTPLPK